MIPKRLIRSVPEHTTPEVDALWERAKRLHPDWEHVDLRDPVDPDMFPLTSPHWHRCRHGAQRAGLIRLEELHHRGGVWLDSDVHVFKALDPLLGLQAFAAYEGDWIVPDAVLGAEAGHPVLKPSIDLAVARLLGQSGENPPRGAGWTVDRGPWATGPGVTTTLWTGRDDVTILPKETFYEEYCDPRDTLEQRLAAAINNPHPDAFGQHLWNWSWR